MDTLRSNLYQLAVFAEAMERKSLTRAAETFMVSQPVVSRIVRALEREYGATLIRRDGNAVLPTAAGEAVLGLATTALRAHAETRQMLRELERLATSRLRLGITSSAYERAMPILAGFFMRYPDAEINVRTDSSITIADAVRSNELDAGIVIMSPETTYALESTRLWDEVMVPIIAPEHPLRFADPNDPGWAALSIVSTTSPGHQALIATRLIPMLPRGHDYAVVQCGSPQFVRELVHEGVGIGMLPLVSVENDILQGKLARLDLSPDPVNVQMHFITNPRSAASPILRRVHRELLQRGG